MQLEPLQSIVFLFVLLALVGCGVFLRWQHQQRSRHAVKQLVDEMRQVRQETIAHVMDGRTAVARQLCGQAHCWNPTVMTYFDHNKAARAPWLAEADRQIEKRNHHAAPAQ